MQKFKATAWIAGAEKKKQINSKGVHCSVDTRRIDAIDKCHALSCIHATPD